jgi:hypothetical protein
MVKYLVCWSDSATLLPYEPLCECMTKGEANRVLLALTRFTEHFPDLRSVRFAVGKVIKADRKGRPNGKSGNRYEVSE